MRTTTKTLVWAAALGAILSTGCKGSRSPDQQIPATVIPPASYAETAGVTDDVKAECELEMSVPQWIAENAPGASPGVAGDANRVLAIEITHMMGAGGGAWSGPKQLVVSGTLTENGTTIGTFQGRRTTGGGMYAKFKTTCSMLSTCGEELGEDIGVWLQNPTMDAKLGEF